MIRPTFADLERAGWTQRAGDYDGCFAPITRQSIEVVLDGLGRLEGRRLLDVACGTGHLAGAAAARGAEAEGLDFSAAMVAQAAGNYPNCVFTEGDAGHLPYDDACFDAVACSFGVHHLEDAEAAFREARRVLRPGGRYAFTVWRGPDEGGEMFAIVMDAVREHGTLEVDLPPAPPIFRFADSEECTRVLRSSGFESVESQVLSLQWRGPSPQAFLEMVYKGVVRMPLILERQSESALERIHAAILEAAAGRRDGDGVVVCFPALLTIAVRPA